MRTVKLGNFKKGIDRSRIEQNSEAGTLYDCSNVHLTKGGEAEKVGGEEEYLVCNTGVYLGTNTEPLALFDFNGFLGVIGLAGYENPPNVISFLFPSKGWSYLYVPQQLSSRTVTDWTLGTIDLGGAGAYSISLPSTNTAEENAIALWTEMTGNAGIVYYEDPGGDFVAYRRGAFIIIEHDLETGDMSLNGSVVYYSNGAYKVYPVKVYDVEVYIGSPYVTALMSDGSIMHFYGYEEPSDFYNVLKPVTYFTEQKSSGTITCTAGSVSGTNSEAKGSIEITGGTNGNFSISLNTGTFEASVLTGSWSTLSELASLLVQELNARPQNKGYFAYIDDTNDQLIHVEAKAPGSDFNDTFNISATGDLTYLSTDPTGGSRENGVYLLGDSVSVNNFLSTPIPFSNDTTEMILDLYRELKKKESPLFGVDYKDGVIYYRLYSTGSPLSLYADTEGVTLSISLDREGLPADLVLDTGASSNAWNPGKKMLSYQNRLYTVTNNLLLCSAAYDAISNTPEEAANDWDVVGGSAASVDLSLQSTGDNYYSVDLYSNNLAVFGNEDILIYGSDFHLGSSATGLIQRIRSNGIQAYMTPLPAGAFDTYFLSEDGFASIRARKYTDGAFVSDLGNTVNAYVQEYIKQNNIADIETAKGILDVRTGRLYFNLHEKIFVYNNFYGTGVEGWTIYDYESPVKSMAVSNGRFYILRDNIVYCIGGFYGDYYDNRLAYVHTNFIPTNNEDRWKYLHGYDLAAKGEWEVKLGQEPADINVLETLGTSQGTTYNDNTLGAIGQGTLFSFKASTTSAEKAVLSGITLKLK